MLNDNAIHLKLKKKKERKELFLSPSKKEKKKLSEKGTLGQEKFSLGLGEKLTMTWEDEGRKGMMDFPLVLGKQGLGKKPVKQIFKV